MGGTSMASSRELGTPAVRTMTIVTRRPMITDGSTLRQKVCVRNARLKLQRPRYPRRFAPFAIANIDNNLS
jgi:hypothetical protein